MIHSILILKSLIRNKLSIPSALRCTLTYTTKSSFTTAVISSAPVRPGNNDNNKNEEDITSITDNDLNENQMQSNFTKHDVIEQRQVFEESLKLAAANLSNRTPVSILISLLRVSTFLDNTPLSLRLVDYIKPKMNTLSNEEVASLHSSLVLVSSKLDPKIIKLLEYVTLRRVHSLSPSEIT
jgi:hypothetical protein